MSTYNPIASVTLSSSQTFVTFNNIPQTYTDLVLAINGFMAVGDGSVPRFRLNNDSGNNYSLTALTGTGSIAKSSRYSNQSSLFIGSNDIGWSTTSGNRSTNMLNIMNYSSSNTFKATLCNTSQPAGSYPGYELEVGTWRSTAPVTSLTIYAGTIGNTDAFASTTTFNLYGVANASIDNVAKATGGDSVYTDGTYWYHIFRSSGTFTPTQALTADYLVVAGGGGGGGAGGSGVTAGTGAGAGGYRYFTSVSGFTASTAYTVTVGAGGAGGLYRNNGADGNNSSLSGSGITTRTSTGGGGGTNETITSLGGSGGSGSGSSNGQAAGSGNAGGYTPSEGNAGGVGSGAGGAGGGGGSGSVGNNASTTLGGNGGAGTNNSITGTSVAYAGGGGGGSYGNADGASGSAGGGGGGNGNNPSSNATANTGSGGGGGGGNRASASGTGGNGGSGIVIVRYSV